MTISLVSRRPSLRQKPRRRKRQSAIMVTAVFMMIILTIILSIRSSITITARMDIITMKNIESSRYLQWKWEMYLT